METYQPVCACSGIRSCLLCEPNPYSEVVSNLVCWFCVQCWKIYEGDVSGKLTDESEYSCSLHFGMQECCFQVDGIKVYPDFISHQEESSLIDAIEKKEWKMSQSGRRKQDFGPKVNFKKQKVKMGSFCGFPSYSKFLIDRMKTVDSLSRFFAVELCNLEYMSERGSSIDPHIDDTWLWGEQLVTINLISTTILTLLKDKNVDLSGPCQEVQILMPPRSLVVLEKDARFIWTHSIKREHVAVKRIAMTFRNLSNEFLNDEKQKEIIEKLYGISDVFITSVS